MVDLAALLMAFAGENDDDNGSLGSGREIAVVDSSLSRLMHMQRHASRQGQQGS